MTTTNNTPVASLVSREEARRAPRIHRDTFFAGLAFTAVIGGVATLAWAVSSGVIYGVTVGDALTATLAGNALALGAALKVGGGK